MARLTATVRACTVDVRLFMNDLRPTVLDDFGLWEALREHIERLADEVSFAISLSIDPALERWRTPHEALLYRLLQEALLNARKHAQASQVRVACHRAGDAVVLEVTDDGRGFDPAAIASGHYGLLTMRERAEAIGGRCDIVSARAHGTTVRVTLPAGDAA